MKQLFAPAPATANATAAATTTAVMSSGPGALTATNASAIGFYTDFSSMGNVWWGPLAKWAAG